MMKKQMDVSNYKFNVSNNQFCHFNTSIFSGVARGGGGRGPPGKKKTVGTLVLVGKLGTSKR